ncbi:hypothetical protein AB6A40_010519 [Gnathostoma spinigerum]|uniref:Tr-type G domain-containing protein n=1 Tax=Gnathostoma spinigerum TaxID=75299 RepID=A0ABD6EV19_9BILA
MKKLIRLDRLRWLLFLRMYSSGKAKNLSSQYRMPSFGNIKQSDIRNVGIIAHIDAGKTTVTERALFLAGVTKFIGDVDSGNTVTDFMELERERGITIQSAAVSLMWGGKQINLIDTPGHVDFTLEVERCIRVLDGAIVILDASAGVQAQTITVWRQAQKFSLPSVVFINKMDKTGADFEKSVESLTSRLGVGSPIPICLPTYSSDGQLTGIIDLLHHCFLDINQKNSAKWNKLTETSKNFNELMSGREELLSKIADIDDAFAELLLSEPTAATESSSMDSEVLSAIKRLTKARKMVPVVCGSALRVTTSVVPLLDMCAELLPAPNERNQAIPTIFGNKFCSLVFKVYLRYLTMESE